MVEMSTSQALSTEEPRIRDGVFFAQPPELPHGPHGLKRDEVLRAQQERAMIAVTELLATRGYREIGIREIARTARLSTTAFYRCFPDKDACLEAAYQRYLDRLRSRLLHEISDDERGWPGRAAAIIECYLDLVSSDPVASRAFLVEMDAAGPQVRRRRREVVDAVATALKERRDERWPAMADVPVEVYVAVIHMVRQIATDGVDHGVDAAELRERGRRLTPWIERTLTP